ncbi:MAG: heme ABC exporter ATP-binding protein CcmA [Acidobacteria bacterium]|nr:MAG: heme ABC exporter, ATP-binding protein CcmA [Acidobacteria bacterium 13_1_40CM_2_56_11]PYR69485.1 MAG: heme ABC exporter ATP-binding protein CcmA [Acidobacteriota bacterium]
MPDTFALESEDIRKTFGHFTALAGVTLGVKRGEFLALFGRNGAGKTTFLKIAATLVRQSQGKLRVEGIDTREEPERARRHIGFLSHNTYLYRDLNPVENLRFFSRLYGMPDSEERILALLDRVGLRRRASDPVRAFSRGLHQRLGIARVMLHDPSVILLDEPYTGLDANAVEILNQILDQAASAGKTIVLTSHDLEQGLRAATRAAIIDRGKIVFDSGAKDPAIRDAYSAYIRLGVGR